MKELKEVMKASEKVTPLLSHAWKTMSGGYREIIGRTDPIVKVSSEAKEIAEKDKEASGADHFVRSDIGQIIGIMPEDEVYYGPTIGKPELRSFLAEFWARFYKIEGLSFENVAITTGATEALGILIALLGYREKVMLTVPHWPTFPDAILRAGSSYETIEVVSTTGIVDERGKLNEQELKDKVNSEGIRTIIINFPNNPSGIALDEKAMREFAEFARAEELIIISDEVYNRVRFNSKPQTMLAFAPERTVVVGAGSKEYLIPGHRVGYVISKSPTLTDVFFKKIVRCQSSCPGVEGQSAMIKIIKKEVEELREGKSPSFLAPILEKLKERRDALYKVLKEAGFIPYGNRLPDGSIFMLAKIPENIKLSDVEFVDRAMELRKISAIPGSSCGKPGWIRLCFGSMSIEDIHRFGKNLKALLNLL